ncbi:MAG TPA: hypothetical protein VJI33_02855, partial [Candidatus Paceibacterota bacterium]
RLRIHPRSFASGMNPQIRKSIGGADTSATKFSPMPRLIPRGSASGIACLPAGRDEAKLYFPKTQNLFDISNRFCVALFIILNSYFNVTPAPIFCDKT